MRTPEQIEEALDKVDSLLKQFDEANDRFDRGEWSKKYSEKFAPYEDKLKRLNGDDFDIMKESYDEYHKDYSDLSDDDYANSLEENIKKVLSRVWPEEPEKVEQAVEEVKEATAGDFLTGDEPVKEEIHVESEDKDGNGEISNDETEVHAMEEKPSEEPEVEESEDDTSDIEAFVKELEDYKANMPRRNK